MHLAAKDQRTRPFAAAQTAKWARYRGLEVHIPAHTRQMHKGEVKLKPDIVPR